jgi:hypothetical protein
MTSRRILTLVLLALCLPAFACSSDSDETPSNSPEAKATAQTEYSRDLTQVWKNGKDELSAALQALNKAQDALKASSAEAGRSSGKPTPSPKGEKKIAPAVRKPPADDKSTVNLSAQNAAALDRVKDAIQALDRLDQPLAQLISALSTRTDASASVTALGDVQTRVRAAQEQLNNILKQSQAVPVDGASSQADGGSGKLASNLGEVQNLLKPANDQLGKILVPRDMNRAPSFFSQLVSDWGMTAALVVGSVLTLLLLVFVGRYLLKTSAGHVDDNWIGKIQPSLSSIKKQQAEMGAQLTSLSANQVELSRRLEDIHAEVRSVSRIVREVALDGVGRRPPVSTEVYGQVEQPSLKDEPSFPISAIDYLGKMQRFSNIVRPDFQNGILVNDPQGKGELVLIRDSRLPEETQPLFVIPRSTQFQTKQDFYTYYEKYYDCAKPSAGDVWIIDPAVVSTVHGGWQLREKGVLEVR